MSIFKPRATTPALEVPNPPTAPATATPWMDWMRSHLGEPEYTGKPATPFDKEVFSHTSYGPLKDGIMQPGCAATAAAALEETGFKSPHNAAAISFVQFGSPCPLKPGCIMVFQWDTGEHHVSFCDHVVDGNLVAGLGGNQTHELRVSVFSRKYLIATRWPV